jgi:hypothetical protein
MQVVLEILFDVFLFMLVDSQEVLVKKYGLSPWLAWAVRLSALAAVVGASLWWYYRS